MTEVIWTRAAIDDLNDILSYAAARNAKGAATLAEKVGAAAKALQTFPRASRYIAETNTYEAVVRGVPLLLIYEINSDASGNVRVEILSVFHTSQNPSAKQGRRPDG